MDLIPIVSILSVFVAAPCIVFSFIYFMKKNKHRLEELRYRRDILELEIENAKYDRLIADERRG